MKKILFLLLLFVNSEAFAYVGSSISNSTTKATGTTTQRTFADRFTDHINVKDFGAKCDGFELLDVTTTSGSANISSASYTFVAADVGKKVYLYESTDNGTNTGRKLTTSETTISSVSLGVATLSATATVSVSGTARMVMYTTDDTTALQLAINTATPTYNGNVGTVIELPKGICVTQPLTLKRQVVLRGQNQNVSTLFLIGASNATFITSENFATLTGTAANYGTNADVPSWYGLQYIKIDGNRAYQTAGNCVSFYGNAQIRENTIIQNCYATGYYSEASTDYAYNPTDWRATEECFYDNNIIRNTGSHGWHMRGCHDSTTGLELSYDWGYLNRDLTVTGVTRANPAVVTYTGTDPMEDDIVRFSSVGGMVELNYATNGSVQYRINNLNTTANTFELQTLENVNINSSAYTAYTSGGNATGVSYGFINEYKVGVYNGGGHFGQIHPYTARGTLKTNLYLGAGSDYQKIYSDLGSTTIAAKAIIDDMSMFGCGWSGTTKCLEVTTTGDYVKIARFGGTWYSGTITAGTTMIDVPSGAAPVEINFSGSSTTNTAANGTFLKVRGAFGKYTGVMSNTTGTGSICLDAGGSYNIFDYTTFGCKIHTSYTAGSGKNQFFPRNYDAGGETLWSGSAPLATDYVQGSSNSLGVNSARVDQITGTAPAVASGAGDCGTSPSIVGNNRVGKVTVGSGANGGKCTITFANSFAYVNAPVCQVADITTPANVVRAVTTTTTLAITAAASITAGDVLSYSCMGYY